MLLGKYTYGPVQLYAGYEYISFEAPSKRKRVFRACTLRRHGAAAAGIDPGGKALLVHMIISTDQIYVAGNGVFRAPVQNTCSFLPSKKVLLMSAENDGVSPNIDKGCLGMASNNGLASGFLFNNTINPTAGLRFRF
jgi:hypothetical protein